MNDCKSIEYRVVVAVVSFIVVAILAFTLLSGSDGGAQDFRALVIGLIALLTIGVRFITSAHRHVINFEMHDQMLHWRSPAIDYKEMAEAAHAVREFARKRGILREGKTWNRLCLGREINKLVRLHIQERRGQHSASSF